MRPSHWPWIAAASILLAGTAGAFLAPRRLPKRGPQVVARWAQQVVEGNSPIVGADGTLVENLGIETTGGVFMTVIAKGGRPPVGRMLSWTTASPDQHEIVIHVLRGLSERAAEDRSLGWFRIGLLPQTPPGAARAAVFLRVSQGTIGLMALDPAHQSPLPVGPTDPQPGS